MQAYEFLAKAENGVIPIPEEFKNRITSDIKVIVIEMKSSTFNREQVGAKQKSDLLLPPTLDTSGWKFSRELPPVGGSMED